MTAKLLVGTVRARRGAMHTVVLKDGTRHDLLLKGDEAPRIGGDVIGMVDLDLPQPELVLVKDVARHILQGRTLISMGGRPDVTARMLARILEGTGPALVRPGMGGIIERTPVVDDPDLRWAIDFVEPEARDLGLALNVIDPLALAGASWSDSTFDEELLPADAVGASGGLGDLKRLMREGFRPSCRRTMEEVARNARDGSGGARARGVSSVDFILPFSPFATGHSFSADVGRAHRSELATSPLSTSEARRLSAFREIALAFAQRHLGRSRGDPRHYRHVEDAFADVAAVTAFVKTGGSVEAASNFARLREAALARWSGIGEPPPATYLGLRQVLPTLPWIEVTTASQAFAIAASVATSTTPRSDKAMDLARSKASDDGVFVDLKVAPSPLRRRIRKSYEADLEAALSSLDGSPRAIERFSRYGLYTAPMGLERAFDDGVAKHAAKMDGASLAREDSLALGADRLIDGLPSFDGFGGPRPVEEPWGPSLGI